MPSWNNVSKPGTLLGCCAVKSGVPPEPSKLDLDLGTGSGGRPEYGLGSKSRLHTDGRLLNPSRIQHQRKLRSARTTRGI